MWNFKTLNIQRMFQKKKFQNFKVSKVLHHVQMGYNVYDVLKKFIA
jgi:ribosomal protein S18